MEFSLKKWVRYEPSLPGNREAPPESRFALEVLSGLSWLEFSGAIDGVRGVSTEEGLTEDARIAAIAKHLEPVMRIVSASDSTIDGRAITTTGDYVAALYAARSGFVFLAELLDKVTEVNRIEGLREVFSVRPSGGSGGTPAPKTEPSATQPAAP